MYRVTPQLLLTSSRVPPILRLEPSSPLSTSSAVMSEETSKPFYKRFGALLMGSLRYIRARMVLQMARR